MAVAEYIVALDVTRVRFPADAFQLCGQQFGIPLSLLHVLQTKTNGMAAFEDPCAKAMPTEVALQHLASDMRSHSPKPYFAKVMPMDSEAMMMTMTVLTMTVLTMMTMTVVVMMVSWQ